MGLFCLIMIFRFALFDSDTHIKGLLCDSAVFILIASAALYKVFVCHHPAYPLKSLPTRPLTPTPKNILLIMNFKVVFLYVYAFAHFLSTTLEIFKVGEQKYQKSFLLET